jgi:hypothetical protein
MQMYIKFSDYTQTNKNMAKSFFEVLEKNRSVRPVKIL